MANGATDSSLGSLAGMGAGAALGGPLGATIGGSAGGLIGSLFGGGADKDALNALKRAQEAIQNVPSPSAEDMKLVLEPLVQQGILTPEAYSTILQQPSQFLNLDIDQTARNAELSGLNQLQNIASAGGMDAEYRNAMNNAMNQANTQLEGQKESILQNAEARGTLNSNLTAATQLGAAQDEAVNANQFTSNAAAQAEQRALQAIADSANLGGQINAQDYKQASDKAAAMDAINRYNAMNSQQQSNMNVQGRNQAQAQNLDMATQIAQYNNQLKNSQAQWNAQLPQQVFQNNLSKAEGAAGIAQPISNLLQGGANAQATTQGNLIGGMGQNLTNYYNNQNLTNALSKLGQPSVAPAAQANPTPVAMTGNTNGGWAAAHGGVVPGKAPIPGDHPANDMVPARLSPGEVVVPRSAAGNPMKLADFIAHLPARGTPKIHPDDVKTVLQALTQHRMGMSYGGRVC